MSTQSVINKHLTLTAQGAPECYCGRIYFAKIQNSLAINTDNYNGEEQREYLKRMYDLTEEELADVICGDISNGLIRFYSGADKHPAELSELAPRELATILNTHNAFFKHTRFKVYNGILNSVPVHL